MAAKTLGLRNNNPGNIEFGPFAIKYGGVPGEGGRFARFPTMATGIRAMCELLIVYSVKPADPQYGGKGLIDTIAEVIYRWCPPKGPSTESRAKTESYIAMVCSLIGCSRDDRFDFHDPVFLAAMACAQGVEENGSAFDEYVTDADIDAGVEAALAA